MSRIAAFAAGAALFICLAEAPLAVSAAAADNDPGDRSNTGDVRTSGIPGADQYSIMQIGPSATDWMGLSRSSAYWVADRDDRSGSVLAQNVDTGSGAGNARNWGLLGLLGLAGLGGLFKKSRMR